MSLVFLNVNGATATQTVYYCGYGQPNWMTDHNDFTVTADDSAQSIKDLLGNVNAHTYDVVMGTQPYLTGYYDGTNVVVTLRNPSATPPTTATFNVLGVTYTETISAGVVKLPISVHASLTSQRLEVTVAVAGFTNIYVQVGGSGSNVQAQVYQDSSGVVHAVPQTNADLASYWQAQAMNPVWSNSDIATITGITAYMVFHYIIPSLMNGTYTPITLSDNERNGVTDIQNAILPNIPSAPSVIAPVPASGATQTYDVHYSSYRAHIQSAHTAMQNYVNDRTTILQYTTLK